MKNILFIVAVLAAVSNAVSAQTADEIIAKYVAARGLDKLQQAQTMRLTRHLVINGEVLRQVLEYKRPASWRRTLWWGSVLQSYESWNGSAGWTLDSKNGQFVPKSLDPDEDAVADNMEGPFVNAKSKGYSLELKGKKQVQGWDCYEVRVAMGASKFETRCIDTESYLDIERGGTSYHGRAEASDYRDVQGIRYAFAQHFMGDDGSSRDTFVDKVEFNVPMDDSLFAKPSYSGGDPGFFPLPSMALARAILIDSIRNQGLPNAGNDATHITLTDDGYSYGLGGKSYTVSFSILPFVGGTQTFNQDVNGQPTKMYRVILVDKNVDHKKYEKHKVQYPDTYAFVSEIRAKRLVDAINGILATKSWNTYSSDTQDIEEFHTAVRAIKSVKVTDLGENAHKQKVLAEDAYKEKNPDEAALHYQLAVSYAPNWAEGWFNAAALHGELKCYAQAILEMQRYLDLMPNSPDAPAARDKIIIWQSKLGK